MTGAARRALGVIIVAATSVVLAMVLLWPAATKPPTVASGASRVVESESPSGSDSESGSVTAPPVRDRALAQAERPRIVSPAVTPSPAPKTKSRSPMVAAILEPPQPPRAPPPPKPAELAIQQRLSIALAQNPGTELKFVVCDKEGAPCQARVQARELDTVVSAAKAASSQYDGHVDIKIREQPTGFNGRYFVADLQVGTQDQHTVPTEIDHSP